MVCNETEVSGRNLSDCMYLIIYNFNCSSTGRSAKPSVRSMVVISNLPLPIFTSKSIPNFRFMLQINRLIEKRERLHRHYAVNEPFEELQQENEDENESIISERDHQFLKLVDDLLEQHLTNADFSVDNFAAMTNTGRTLFFKKIKYLTGYSPNEFIRVRRMKKAAELLKTYKYNVSEVSYMVGINDPFYFSKCFKA